MKNIILKLFKELFKEWKNIWSKQNPVIFDHLPKYGGSSINLYLTNTYPRRYTYRIAGNNPKESVDNFKALQEKNRLNYKLVYGHLANELFDYVNQKAVFCVVIREPIDRIVSHYFYVKRRKDHYLHKIVEDNGISLEEYCYHNLSDELENWYVTHFSGLNIYEAKQNPKKAVALALDNIVSKYNIIGFQDDIPSFINELSQKANIMIDFENKIENKTLNRVKSKELNVDTIEKISQKNSLDIEFYNELILLRSSGKLK